ncbi:MAG: Lrp/AsnC family transcriptional regulator [Burkholderiales bacterium]|nr:Lrp/AsnC family transcriptional regulator [Burkholderiales bacterium]
MDRLEQRLLNDFQRGLPLVPRPFAEIGARLGIPEMNVISMLRRFIMAGKVSRVGATFVPGRIGAATLATLSVPRERLPDVAGMVSACPEVNHNYEREHRFNLWFVVTGPDERHVETVVRRIGRIADCGRVLSLPTVEAYHADLGFDISGSTPADAGRTRLRIPREVAPPPVVFSASEHALAAALQKGLSLVARPYAELGRAAGLSEPAVIATLTAWLEHRIVNRLGVIVRHHELGFSANAMAVWDVPNVEVRSIGSSMAQAQYVTLCYRRLRHLPEWPYNLYCMIHGTSRDGVLARIAELNGKHGLDRFPHAVLFSRRRFKQSGARYLHSGLKVAANG